MIKDAIRTFEWGTIKDALETIGKVAIGIFVLSYVLGIFVVNIYLSQFGVHSLSLFRLHYVTAGAWAFVIVLLPSAALAGAVLILMGSWSGYWAAMDEDDFDEEEKEEVKPNSLEPTWRDYFDFFSVIIIGFIIVGMAIAIISGPYILELHGAVRSGVMFTLMGLMGILSAFVRTGWHSNTKMRVGRSILASIAIVLAFIYYLSLFSVHVYGTIPAHVGGGKPVKAELHIDPEMLSPLHIAEFKSPETSEPKSIFVSILTITETDYVVLPRNPDGPEPVTSVVASIPKDSVKMVLFVPRREQERVPETNQE